MLKAFRRGNSTDWGGGEERQEKRQRGREKNRGRNKVD